MSVAFVAKRSVVPGLAVSNGRFQPGDFWAGTQAVSAGAPNCASKDFAQRRRGRNDIRRGSRVAGAVLATVTRTRRGSHSVVRLMSQRGAASCRFSVNSRPERIGTRCH
jgi:hypothetical protein